MANTTKQTSVIDNVKHYFIYLGIYLVIMGIIWLFIRPSFNRWQLESKLAPIEVSSYRDGGHEKAWLSDDYIYYVNVGYKGGSYKVEVSNNVYTGITKPVFYYDESNDVVFEGGTGHTKVIIYFLTLATTFILIFVWYPISSSIKSRKNKKIKQMEEQIEQLKEANMDKSYNAADNNTGSQTANYSNEEKESGTPL